MKLIDALIAGALIGLLAAMIFDLIDLLSKIDYYLVIAEKPQHALKNRIITQGNIIKYPFRTEERETARPIDRDSVIQSGEEPEKTS